MDICDCNIFKYLINIKYRYEILILDGKLKILDYQKLNCIKKIQRKGERECLALWVSERKYHRVYIKWVYVLCSNGFRIQKRTLSRSFLKIEQPYLIN